MPCIAPPQGVIACLLNGAMQPAQLPRTPVRPTHSRNNSASGALELGALSLGGGGPLEAGASSISAGLSGRSFFESTAQPSEVGWARCWRGAALNWHLWCAEEDLGIGGQRCRRSSRMACMIGPWCVDTVSERGSYQ
jgi:hypothetical protein